MLRKMNKSSKKFADVSATLKSTIEFYRSKTDKRMVLDIVAPGFSAEDVDVVVAANQKSVTVTLDPTGHPPLDADGDPDNFGYNAIKIRNGVVTETFELDPKVYDIAKLTSESWFGVIRIAVPKKELPGTVITTAERC